MNIYAFVYSGYSPKMEEEFAEHGFVAAASMGQATDKVIKTCGVDDKDVPLSISLEQVDDMEDGVLLWEYIKDASPLDNVKNRIAFIEGHLIE